MRVRLCELCFSPSVKTIVALLPFYLCPNVRTFLVYMEGEHLSRALSHMHFSCFFCSASLYWKRKRDKCKHTSSLYLKAKKVGVAGMASLEELDREEPHQGNKPNPTRFVEELANEQDYWMSLTDAARVTRTSEPMVRRWVTAGRLPVRKEPAGINQRTRLVRASDVAQIRPIIDPTAAITDEIHKLDLLSIPRQQEHIIRDQQLLAEQIQAVRQEIEAQVKPIQASLEQHATELSTLSQEWMQRFTVQ